MEPTNIPPITSKTEALRSLVNPLDFFYKNLLKYPKIFSSGLLSFSAYVIHCPEFIKHITTDNYKNYKKGEKYGILRFLAGNGLVTNDSESWLQQRRLVQPFFNHAAIVEMVASMERETRKEISKYKTANHLDVSESMAALTLSIVGNILFGVKDVSDKLKIIREEMETYQRIGNILLRIPFKLPSNTLNFPLLYKMKRAVKRLDQLIYGMIESRKNSTIKYNDLFERLMHAKDSDTFASMTNKQLRDEVLTLFLAGHETTMLSLSWTFFLLAKHQTVQEKIYQEFINKWKPDEALNFETIKELNYLDNVIYESLRLYPPAYIIARKAEKDDYLEKFLVPKGTDVFINVYGIHRHPKYWKDPLSFKPERFENFNFKGQNKYFYLPFGSGPRFCVGSHFSLLEMKIVIILFLSNFKLSLVDKGKIKMAPLITLKPKNNIKLRIQKR